MKKSQYTVQTWFTRASKKEPQTSKSLIVADYMQEAFKLAQESIFSQFKDITKLTIRIAQYSKITIN